MCFVLSVIYFIKMREKRLKKLNKAEQERLTQEIVIDDQEELTAEQTNEEV
jgi:hypothetical protein